MLVHIQSGNRRELLMDFLNQLLHIWKMEHFGWMRIDLDVISESELTARLDGEKVKPSESPLRSIQPATYNQVEIGRGDSGTWQARFVFLKEGENDG